MKISLSEQVILVSGGSRGIGAAVVEILCQAGAWVAIHYNQHQAGAEALAEKTHGRGIPFQADLEDPHQARKLVREVIGQFGRIDGLVNNAGVAIPLDERGDFDEWLQGWEQTLRINLLAGAVLARECLGFFLQKQRGRMVHISSRAAFRGDTPEYMAYAASKGGMVSLSRSIARGYGKRGIKSFVVAPGFIKTDMAQQFIDIYGEPYVVKDLALGELTLPSDLAPTVLFLLSGMMDHATGCTIDVNAGSYVH